MQKFIEPLNSLTEDERKRRMLQPGERVSFDMMMMDRAAPRGFFADAKPSAQQLRDKALADRYAGSDRLGRNIGECAPPITIHTGSPTLTDTQAMRDAALHSRYCA